METLVFIVHDITDLKLSDQRLAQRQHMVEAVFEGISDPLIMLDKEMRVKLLNTAAKKYYGLSSASAFEDICCFKSFRNRETPCEGCRLPSALENREYLCYERTGFNDPQRTEQVTPGERQRAVPEEQRVEGAVPGGHRHPGG